MGKLADGSHDSLTQQLRHARQHMVAAEERLAVLHQLCDAVLAVADALLQHRRDERRRLGDVELAAARQALLRQRADLVQEDLVALARQEMHGCGLRMMTMWEAEHGERAKGKSGAARAQPQCVGTAR